MTGGIPIRVLHVDDPERAATAASSLEREGDRLTVDTATSVAEGLDRLGADIDCVVSGYDLPGDDGLAFLRAVREAHPALPFVLFTGEGSERVASEAISAGVTDYVRTDDDTAPYDDLADRLRRVVARRRTDHDLEAIRDRVEFVLDATDSTIFEVDYETGAETRHGPFERLYGIPSDEVPTRSAFYETCIHPADRERVEQLQQPGALDARNAVEYEFRTHPDLGAARWIYTRIYVETGPADDPSRVVGLNTDITERKRRERALERQNERLEEFDSIVSHDLRSPLNAVQGRLDLAREECDSDHLADADDALDRAHFLIDDLLTLARQGDRVGTLEPVRLAAVIEDCWRTVGADAATLETDTERTIRADHGRLRQLLGNLLRNAVEHAGEAVTVTVGDLSDGFYVADDGPGIPADEREAVFETGYSTADGGTGLGLNIVRGIAEAHGWTVTVGEGDPGARFEITGVETV